MTFDEIAGAMAGDDRLVIVPDSAGDFDNLKAALKKIGVGCVHSGKPESGYRCYKGTIFTTTVSNYRRSLDNRVESLSELLRKTKEVSYEVQ